MKIYYHWFLPVIGPFVVIGQIRSVSWVAGANWSEPGAAAFTSLFLGGMGGALIASFIQGESGDKPYFTIGRSGNDDE